MTEIVVRHDKPWAAVLSVAAGTFAMVTTEFSPIGLLSKIANQFDVSEGQAGFLVTMPGFVAAFTAPAVTLLAGRTDRRLLLMFFSALLVISNMIMAFAPDFITAVIGRALLGISVGGFWTFAAAIGRRLVGDEHGNRATSIIMAGISIGTVLGVPIGTFIGDLAGWRTSFAAAGMLCLVILLFQAIVLPRFAVPAPPTLAMLVKALTNKDLSFGFLIAALASCAHFMAYTYLEPHLVNDLSAGPVTLGWLFALYGAAGIVGTFVGEPMSSKSAVGGFFTATLGMGLAIALAFLSGGIGMATFAVALWGLSFGAIPVCVQIWTYKSDPVRFESSSAVMVAVFQIALAAGSFLGGGIVDQFGLNATFLSGAVLSLCCVCLLAIYHAVRTEPGSAVSQSIDVT